MMQPANDDPADAAAILKKDAKKMEKRLNKFSNWAAELGVEGVNAKIREQIDGYKSIPIKIAIIGGSGTGKSSLINAFMGITADDKNAAAVGVKETTVGMQKYSNPKNKYLEFWDIPGVGTPKFPQESYLKDIKIDDYDFYIITSQARFTVYDIWLAIAVLERKKQFYFVRTMIDLDIYKESLSHPKTHDPAKVLQIVRDDCEEKLKEGKVTDPQVFLIASMFPEKYDFSKLQEKLIKDAPSIKKAGLVLSLSAISTGMLAAKREVLQSRIYKAALLAAAGNLLPIPGMSTLIDYGLVKHETDFFREHLGTDEISLAKKAEMIGVSLDNLKKQLALESCDIVSTPLTFTAFCERINASENVGQLSLADNFLGKVIPIYSAVKAYPHTVQILTNLLDICFKEAVRAIEYQSSKIVDTDSK